MMILEIPLYVLVLTLFIAAITDVHSGRIPNWLTFSIILSAPVYYLICDGFDGLIFSLSGIGVGMAVLIFFYLRGGMGAGDVKLMGAIGAIVGPEGVFLAFLGTSIIGGIYALGLLSWYGKLGVHFRKYWITFKLLVLTRSIIYQPDPPEEALPRLRYGVAIAVGTLLSLGVGNTILA